MAVFQRASGERKTPGSGKEEGLSISPKVPSFWTPLDLNLTRNRNLNPAQYRPIFPGRAAAAAAPPNFKATDPNGNLTGLSEATKKSKFFQYRQHGSRH